MGGESFGEMFGKIIAVQGRRVNGVEGQLAHQAMIGMEDILVIVGSVCRVVGENNPGSKPPDQAYQLSTKLQRVL